MNAAWLLPGQTVRLAVAALALIVLTALLVWLLDAGQSAREQLAFRFDGPVGEPEAAFEIAAANLRLVAAALVAAWAVRWRPRLRALLDPVLALLAGLNLTTLGVALGAYGQRLIEAVALHGALELTAFALAGAAYRSARSALLSTCGLVASAAAALALVAAGALAETYVQLGAGP